MSRRRDRIARVEEQIRVALETKDDDWAEFDRAQEALPPEGRITYGEWEARVWGPVHSSLTAQLAVLRVGMPRDAPGARPRRRRGR